MPARVLLQDFTGVPAVVDLAAMRDGIVRLGGNPDSVNPLQAAELVIDHSVQVDHFGTPDAFELNVGLEFSRNKERYAFLKWGQEAFRNFKVVPPGTGIVHQINIGASGLGSSVRKRSTAKRWRTQTRWWAPIPTPRWSMGSVSWAGASVGSRPRRRCSVNRFRCSYPRCSASSCTGSYWKG